MENFLECKAIKVEEMMRLENHHLATTKVIDIFGKINEASMNANTKC